MSALGQKQTLPHILPMSALPPKADISPDVIRVRLVPNETKVQRSNQCDAGECGAVKRR
jgi:hypothetical protein